MADKLLTTEQVAEILQVHTFTILKYIKSGKLIAIKLGRVWRIRESEVEKFLEERSMAEKKPKKAEEVPEEAEEETIEVEKTLSKEEKEEEDKGHYIID